MRLWTKTGNADRPSAKPAKSWFSGSRMMSGYWQEDAATRETLRSGWVYTGDLGYQDEDGYIYLAGRSKDFIKRGGEMVSPEEVEQVLMSHPQIDDAAVIGVADVEWGEEIRAVVVTTLPAAPPGSGEGEPPTEDGHHRVLPRKAGRIQAPPLRGVR